MLGAVMNGLLVFFLRVRTARGVTSLMSFAYVSLSGLCCTVTPTAPKAWAMPPRR